MSEYTPWIKHHLRSDTVEALLGAFVTDYLNRADVRTALNIPKNVTKAWVECSEDIIYNT